MRRIDDEYAVSYHIYTFIFICVIELELIHPSVIMIILFRCYMSRVIALQQKRFLMWCHDLLMGRIAQNMDLSLSGSFTEGVFSSLSF